MSKKPRKRETNKVYDILKDWEQDATLVTLIRSGAISMTVIDWLTYFEYFQQAQSVKETALEFNTTTKTIHKAINYFTK